MTINIHNIDRFKMVTAAVALLFMSACSNDEAPQQANNTPIAIESGDECHLCGMVITGYPGPKGELFEGRKNNARKFCSTRDLMSWYLQPENKPNSKEIYVHDMNRSDWNSPNDDHMIDAKSAWFVVGSSMKGAMGPTLASFAQKEAADKFVTEHGGTVLGFEDITMEILNTGSAMNMGSMHH